VHVSGHACREEQKLMINLCKPKFFMPIHGEYRMLVKHGELAVDCGVSPDNVFIMENGDVLEVTKDKGQKSGRVKSGIILIDSSRNWHINEEIVEQRRHLAEDGLVTIAMAIDNQRKIINGPEIALRGIILPRGLPPEEFVQKVQKEVLGIIGNKTIISKLSDEDLRSYIVGALNRFFSEQMRAGPLVQVILHNIQSAETHVGTKPPSTPAAKSSSFKKET
jgi:ribonuclease J